VEVVKKLLACGVEKESEILVLSPYRAQCHIIERELAANKLSEVSVTSIVKSQGMFERKEIDVVVKLKNLTLACDRLPSGAGRKRPASEAMESSVAWGEKGAGACRLCFDCAHS